MNILFLTIDRTMMVTKHWGWVQDELTRQHNVDFIYQPKHGEKAGALMRKVMAGEIKVEEKIKPYLDKTDKKYDFILTDSSCVFVNEQWNKINIPKAMIMQDLHYNEKKIGNPWMQARWAEKQKWNIIFTRYLLPFPKYHSVLEKISKICWMPHCVNLDMFKDYGLKKEIDVLMTGYHFKEIYPYRHKAYEILKNKSYFKEVKRPSETSNHTKKWPVGEDFFKLLNSAKINITGGSNLNYPILKYMEIAASKSLIFSNYFDELGILGFKPDVNMVEMDFDNLENQIKWWLEHEDERNRVIDNAYNLVKERHTVQTRVKEITKIMEDFLYENSTNRT